MQIIRYRSDSGAPTWGVLAGSSIYTLIGDPYSDFTPGAAVGAVEEVTLLAPVQPSKIICIGRNYAAHAAELGNEVPAEPLIFLKPPSALIGPQEAIVLPTLSERVEHEAELVLVIGKRSRHLSEENAMQAVMGYTCGNDVTARDLQKKDGQWSRAKGFDTFCAIGPAIVPANSFDPTAVQVECYVNDEQRQSGNTTQLIFGLPRLLKDISAVFTLEPGDIIMTGTPAGVSPLQAGDTVKVVIEGIGALVNPVVNDSEGHEIAFIDLQKNMIYLIRHAATQADPTRPATEWPLSQAGRQAARLLAGRRFWPTVQRVITSMEDKSYLTVQPALELWDIPAERWPDFDEVRRGSYIEDYGARVATLFDSPSISIDEWETATDVTLRAAAGWRRVLATYPTETIAIVGHGLLFALLRAHLLGQPRVAVAEWQAIQMPDVSVWDIVGTTLTLVQDFEGIRQLTS